MKELRPKPHGMGKEAWKICDRKLDALYAMYVLHWRTKDVEDHKPGKPRPRPFIKKVGDKWETDMLPYFHDDLRSVFSGVAKVIAEGKTVTIRATQRSEVKPDEVLKAPMYRVRAGGHIVEDEDCNFAIMACLLLVAGLPKHVIQKAWDDQNDWTNRAKRRESERSSWADEV